MKWVRIFFVLVCLYTTFTFPTTATTPKNVIFMVMDGASSAVVTLARLYKENPLALDEILVGRRSNQFAQFHYYRFRRRSYRHVHRA